MHLLSLVVGIVSYVVSRGPDGRLLLFLASYVLIAVAYVTLAWVTRHQAIWLHLPVNLPLFLAMMALGMAPKPRLDEMAGMMYLFAALGLVIMLVLASIARLLARWI